MQTVERHPPKGLLLAEKNARYMKSETFKALVANIKRDGALGSVPLCCREGDKLRVLSGNHRVQAAIEAGLGEITVLVDDRELTRDQKLAIQLSHNSLSGEDDPAILRELYLEIDSLDEKGYSGLDDKWLAAIDKLLLSPLSEAQLEFRTLTMLFLPPEQQRMDDLITAAQKKIKGDSVYVARMQEYNRVMSALSLIENAYNVHNMATAMMVFLDVFEQHVEDLAAGWENDDSKNRTWVPLASVFGTETIPADAAKVIKQAVDRMQSCGDLTDKARWQALEYWAADYLSS